MDRFIIPNPNINFEMLNILTIRFIFDTLHKHSMIKMAFRKIFHKKYATTRSNDLRDQNDDSVLKPFNILEIILVSFTLSFT